jgi:CRP-like cAMP-binding protein
MVTALETPLFAGLNRRERNIAKRLGTTLNVLDGREVTTQGEPGKQFGVVLSGALRVARDGVEVTRLRDGDIFGEISLLAGPQARQTATVEAIGSAEVLVLSAAEFHELCDLIPSVAARVHLIGLRRLARSAV